MKVSLIPCVGWVCQGVAKQRPDKVKLSANELRNLLQGTAAETSETSGSEEDGDESGNEATGVDTGSKSASAKGGLRGSKANDADKADEKNPDQYDLDNYDDDAQGDKGAALRGAACFASPMDDPHITAGNDDSSDDEDDKEDYELKPDDNLLAVGRVVNDEYNLEVWVYNGTSKDWYTHHHYMLDAPPLCVETLAFDPGADNRRGNLAAVGLINCVIGLWDLDVVNAVEPVITLGSDGGGSTDGNSRSKRRKRDGSAQGHADAVLTLSWNKNAEHVLASGGADNCILLWDLEEAKVSAAITSHNNKDSVLLSGSADGRVIVTECKSNDATAQWTFEGVEITNVLWDSQKPFYFYAGGDDGCLRYCDSRKRDDPISSLTVPESSEIVSISHSPTVDGLICCCTERGPVSVVQRTDKSELKLTGSFNPKLGNVHSAQFCPDHSTVLALGGSKGDLIRVVDLRRVLPVVGGAFGLD